MLSDWEKKAMTLFRIRIKSILILAMWLGIFFVANHLLVCDTFAQSATGKAENISYCDISKEPGKFAGTQIRLNVILLSSMDFSILFDPACKKQGLNFEFEVPDDEGWSAIRKEMNIKATHGVDMSRVGIVVVGMIDAPSASTNPKSKPLFHIKRVECVTRVPADVPWP